MSTVYLCDRCNKEIKPTGLLNLMKSTVYYTKLEYLPAIMNKEIWGIGKAKILCEKCGTEFSNWWGEVKTYDDE